MIETHPPKVYGVEEVEAAQVPAGSEVAFFHATDNVFWIKATSRYGSSSIREFRYEEVRHKTPDEKYATKEELKQAFDRLMEAIGDGSGQRVPDGE